MRIVLYVLTALIQLVVAVSGFFILLVGLNGFSERTATPSLIVYIAVSVITVLGDGAFGLFVGKQLARRTRMSAGGANVVGTLLAVMLGVIILVVTLFGGFVLASVIHDARINR